MSALSIRDKIAFFETVASRNYKDQEQNQKSVLLVVGDKIMSFETELEAHEYGIMLAEQHKDQRDRMNSDDEDYESDDMDPDVCPFIIDLAAVDAIDYKMKHFYD